ncbi:hypothetical protein HanHA300_Chr10g0382231 [Helianthus annuus]|nr:hypothetical protein HanHA300_Chr10g0382231 [Helianthus annuus]KAJ0524159.1 hypothetical protein HanIR_Chr10g0501521 [Helianthus annuus]KAJ0531778.1 hypothetical protein HanHA89_Chr10g0404691 [Helianthus annuus]
MIWQNGSRSDGIHKGSGGVGDDRVAVDVMARMVMAEATSTTMARAFI